MPTERITIHLPEGFDPGRHLKAIEKRIAETHGEGFEIDSIDPVARVAFATRQAVITEVDAVEEAASIDVRLPRGTKPSDGERVATKLADQYPGYEMTSFEPFLGKAVLTKLEPAAIRCRGAVAVALGVKPWDIDVTPRRDGGFDLLLSKNYVPSKHDARIDEVATAIVGREGWYVDIDPASLRASIVPGDPPSFPPVVPYPFKAAPKFDPGTDEWAHIPIGLTLGRTGGEEGPELTTDFIVSPHMILQGLTGSGKLLTLDTRVPVPVSERFSSGWATVGTLEEGDSVYAADGSVTTIVGFSEEVTQETYRVTFDSGESVDCGPDHLWAASHHVARVVHSPKAAKRTEALLSRVHARAERLRRIAHAADPGAFATVKTLAALTGLSRSYVWHVMTSRNLPSEEIAVDRGFSRRINRYLADDAIPSLQRRAYLGAASTATEWPVMVEKGSWVTCRELLVALGTTSPTREQCRAARRMMHGDLVPTKSTVEHVSAAGTAKCFPVGEALLALAEECLAGANGGRRKMALEQVVTTAQMFKSQTRAGGGSNWAVRLPKAIDGKLADLPIPPYILGAWLGDGVSRVGQIVAGFAELPEMLDLIRAEWSEAKLLESSLSAHRAVITLPKLTPILRRLDIYRNKHIPASYLRAAAEQRLALLQGLMDTDGTVNRSGACELTFCNERLSIDALELIRSLGIKASRSAGEAAITEDDTDCPGGKRRRVTGTRWRINFTTDQQVFRLRRKAERLPTSTRKTQQWLYITEIARNAPSRMRCLRIAHPSHLHLVEGFVPTHNSVSLGSIVTGALARGWELAIVDAIKGGVDFADFERFVHPGGWGDDLPSACCVLNMAYAEGARRKALIKKSGVQKWTQLPASEGLRPFMLVVDELTSLVAPEPVPKGVSKDNPLMIEVAERNLLKATILTTIGKIARELRFTGVALVIGTQVASTSTGIPTELRSNLGAKVLLGAKPTDNNRRLALNDQDAVPKIPLNIVNDPNGASRGVGVYEFEGQEPGVFKSYFSPPANDATWLAAQGARTTNRPRPTAEEIARHTPSLDDTEPVSSSDDAPGRAGDRSPSGRRPEPVRDPVTGEALHGFEKANAVRHAATVGARQAEQAQGEDF